MPVKSERGLLHDHYTTRRHVCQRLGIMAAMVRGYLLLDILLATNLPALMALTDWNQITIQALIIFGPLGIFLLLFWLLRPGSRTLTSPSSVSSTMNRLRSSISNRPTPLPPAPTMPRCREHLITRR